ncbi:MAG: CHAT domain-containing protein, partial [Bacteroidota bacterium]
NYLYQQILQPLLKYDELPEQLVIIPDGPLYYLPFELLLTDNPTNRKFQDFPYLLKQHAISYCFSSKAFFQLKAKRHRKQPKSKILAVAPSFYKVNRLKNTLYASRDLLDTLYHNTAEVETISTKISCDQLVSKKASKANFIAEVGDYRIIHLATHGKVDDLNPNFSFVAFSNTIDTLKFPYRLYINEINTLSLNADMVVLSACETGLGQIYQGEGILGCSRSFLSIGAKSIITTLWNINDRQTANLMDQFYTQLQQEGLGKAQALRQAKLAYLEASDDFYAHPKYWAAFMAYGDMSAISTHLKPAFNPDVLIFTGLGLALVGLLVSFCIWKRIKRQVG